jgi:hypothetical protein
MITHGESSRRAGLRTTEYKIWCGIIARCFNPKHEAFHRYGGRGITMCDRWRQSFESFLADVGRRPSGKHTLDRIDNNGNYEPGNVRWATQIEQRRNSSSVHFLEIRGERRIIADWARVSGIDERTLRGRILRGWEPERAVFEPAHREFAHPRKGDGSTAPGHTDRLCVGRD